jgi:hypothetical protein
MIVLLHVVTAITSIAFTTYVFFVPSWLKLHISYSLIALTLASGTYLVWSTHARLLQACTTGLLYLGIVSFGVVAARLKLVTASAKNK